MSELTIDGFYRNLMDEISLASESETYGWEAQDFFTAVVLEYLEEYGIQNDKKRRSAHYKGMAQQTMELASEFSHKL